ncbi:MAG: polymer-forming cytoskeletal protein [Halioglobus sp.]
MLGSRKRGTSIPGTTTLVSRDTVIAGDVHFSGNLDIEGLVQGNIIADPGKEALVRVVDKGRVEGEIRVPCVIISGTVEGDVHSDKHLELAARGRVKGNVYYTLLEMAAGSEVNGKLTHLDDSAPGAGEGRDNTADPTVEVTEVAGERGRGKTIATKVD